MNRNVYSVWLLDTLDYCHPVLLGCFFVGGLGLRHSPGFAVYLAENLLRAVALRVFWTHLFRSSKLGSDMGTKKPNDLHHPVFCGEGGIFPSAFPWRSCGDLAKAKIFRLSPRISFFASSP